MTQNPALLAQQATQDERIPGLPVSTGIRTTLLVPAYNPATDKTEQVPLDAPGAGADTFAGLTDSPHDNPALGNALDALQNGVAGALASAATAQGTANANATALALKAPIANPSFTGAPTAPTPAANANNTLIANTAWVVAQVTAAVSAGIANLVGNAPAALDTVYELAAAVGNNTSTLSALLSNIAGRLSIASNLADLQSASAARANLGLGNVSNTSDANKPISAATQTALNGKQPLDSHSVLTYATSLQLDFAAADVLRTVSVTGDLTFAATANKAAAKSKVVRLLSDGTAHALSFPAWTWQGTVPPTTLPAGKVAILSLTCFGTSESDVVAGYTVQP